MSAITAKASRKMKKYAVLTREPRCFLGSFDFSWEQRKAKELFVSTADKGYPELPVLSATQDRGMIRRDENSINIFHDKKNEAGYKRVLPGQFVIHLRSFQGGFAHSAIEGITSPAYTVFGFSEPEKHDSEYWKYVFTSKSFIRRLETVTYGIRDGRSISYDEFLTLGFVYPSKAEQTAIARYLDKLSDLITLHQRKCALLFSSFQALISMMFTTSTFSWEQRKLTEFVEFFSGLTYTPNDVQENGTLVLRSSNVSNGEVVDADNVYVNPQVVNSENVKVGDIVVVVRNGSRSLIGKHAQIKAFMPNTVIGAFMTGIRSECPEFTNALLNTSRFEEEIAMNMGATINQITGYMFSKMEFKVPCLDEQKKIGEYFEKLDRLVTLHQRKCISFTGRAGRLISTVNKKRITSSWEQRKLGELALFNPKDELPQTFEYVDLESVVGTEMLSHRAEVKSSAPSRAQRLAHTGDLFYQTVRPYQKNNYLFEKPDNNYVFSTGYAQMRPYVDGYFLLSLVQSERFVKVVLDNCTGTSYPAINANDLAEIEVAAPSDESEAQKIGTIFRSIDNLITLHQRKPFLMKWRTSDANRNQTNRLVL